MGKIVELSLYCIPATLYRDVVAIDNAERPYRLIDAFPKQIFVVALPSGQIIEVAPELTERMKACGFTEPPPQVTNANLEVSKPTA